MAPRRLPRNAVALDAELTDRRVRGGARREVLLVGELGAALRAELVERGAVLTVVEKIHDAFLLLASRDFDVVVVNPMTEGCGLDFVNAIKEGPVAHELTVATLYGARGNVSFLRGTRPPPQEALDAGRARHRTTPLVVLPTDKSWTYRVVVLPHASFIEDAREVPLVATILTVDAAKLLNGAKPMA